MINKTNKNVFLALHLYRRPECQFFWSSMKAAAALLRKHGYTPYFGIAFGDPYIQKARNKLVKQFLASNCDTLFFVADDLRYTAKDMLRVIETPGRVVVGAYSKHVEPANYPVKIYVDSNKRAVTRRDGCVSAMLVQTGFMRIDRIVFEKIAKAHPELEYYGIKNGKKVGAAHDFFPQGVHNHTWLGEDYAFCKLWLGLGGKIWIVPDLNLTHYLKGKGYPGNFHNYLKQLPGGIDYKEK